MILNKEEFFKHIKDHYGSGLKQLKEKDHEQVQVHLQALTSYAEVAQGARKLGWITDSEARTIYQIMAHLRAQILKGAL